MLCSGPHWEAYSAPPDLLTPSQVSIVGQPPPRVKITYVTHNALFWRSTQLGEDFFKLALTRTPDSIQPTRRGPDPNRPTYCHREGGYDQRLFVFTTSWRYTNSVIIIIIIIRFDRGRVW